MDKIIAQLDIYFIVNIGVSLYFLYLVIKGKKIDNFFGEKDIDRNLNEIEFNKSISIFALFISLLFVSLLIFIKKQIWDKNITFSTIIFYFIYDVFISIVMFIVFSIKNKKAKEEIRDNENSIIKSTINNKDHNKIMNDKLTFIIEIIGVIIFIVVLLDVFKAINLTLMNLIIILFLYFCFIIIAKIIKKKNE